MDNVQKQNVCFKCLVEKTGCLTSLFRKERDTAYDAVNNIPTFAFREWDNPAMKPLAVQPVIWPTFQPIIF
jgi:hypothetical protein